MSSTCTFIVLINDLQIRRIHQYPILQFGWANSVDFQSKFLQFDDKIYKCTIYDTAGQERYKTITESFYRGSHVVYLVYDVTDGESFDNVRNWSQTIKQKQDQPVVQVLIGNKSDLNNRMVSTEIGQALADQLGCPFFETSARSGVNVTEAFMAGIRLCVERGLSAEPRKRQADLKAAPPTNGWCSC
jgi:small GTP-binding protein